MIRLARAMLCLDEEMLYDGSAGRICPACGSPHTFPLARWLNRAEKEVVPCLTTR